MHHELSRRAANAVVLVCGLWVGARSPARADLPPADPAGLAALQAKIQATARKILPTVVAVRGPLPPQGKGALQPIGFASGVIVSEDGLILSQYHVSHQGHNQRGSVPPSGTKTAIIFAGGTEAEAELLGADFFNDVSLLRITKPGKYAFVAVDGPSPRLGEMVLQLGHPLSYRPGRTPPLRLSRVVAATDLVFATDCAIAGGDSGGPFFELDGRLIGIIRNGQVPEAVYGESGRARARGIMPMSVTPTRIIQTIFPAMQQGKIVGSLDVRAEGALQFDTVMRAAKSLPAAQWSQGDKTLSAFQEPVAKARHSVVTILNGAEPTSLGTIVDDGYVLTKASEVPATPTCRLADGKIVAGEVVGVDPAYDLALLRVKAAGLQPIVWAQDEPTLGTLLIAPGTGVAPLAVGILAVEKRDLRTPAPATVVRNPRVSAAPPEILGSTIEGRGYWVEFVDDSAAAAGIRAGDVIVRIGGAAIRTHSDVVAAVADRQAGEAIAVALLRDGKPMEITLTLVRNRRSLFSARADGFPTVFEHDLPLLAAECGGPVVGLDGRAFGVTIARVNVHGSMAIPADHVRRLLPDLKAGKPIATLPPVSVRPSPKKPGAAGSTAAGQPVTLDIDALKKQLKERGDRFQHLFIDYETVMEPLMDPSLLASWGINFNRDYHVRHRFAFSGDKRMYVKNEPSVSAYWIPHHLVRPAQDAPAETVQRLAEQRRLAEANREATGVSMLYLVLGSPKTPRQVRSVFDGKDAYLQMLASAKPTRVDPSLFLGQVVYLEALGLRPVDPMAKGQGRKMQQRLWFPGNFSQYAQCSIRPRTEMVDGADCVVLDAAYETMERDQRVQMTEKIWLDPAVGFAPRRWELWADGTLRWRRMNTQFEEFAPSCWLPWEAQIEFGTPRWVAGEYRNQAAYRNVIRLRRATVNQPKDEWFQP